MYHDILDPWARSASRRNDCICAIRAWTPPSIRICGQESSKHQRFVQGEQVGVLLSNQAFDVWKQKERNDTSLIHSSTSQEMITKRM